MERRRTTMLKSAVLLMCTIQFARGSSLIPSRVVETKYGQIQGLSLTPDGKTIVEAFLGVPFAAPPVGRDRFAPPKPPKTWTDVLKTQNYTAGCYQTASEKDKHSSWFIPDIPESEDCLYLNLWRPAKDLKNMTVMVWIHGGGMFAGTAMDDLYDGSVLAGEENLIVVNMNYRTNLFGLLYLGLPEAPGNVALKDQLYVLEWVKENIAYFGGDPNKVTIFGESAGGWCVGLHVLNPDAQHLFRNAIIQSGTPNFPGAAVSKEDGLVKSLNLAGKVGCPNSTNSDRQEVLNCLLNKTATDLISHYRVFPYYLKFPFMFVNVGPEVPDNTITAPSQVPKEVRKPILLGTMADEFEELDNMYFFPDKSMDENTTITEDEWAEVVKILFGISDKRLFEILTFLYARGSGHKYNPKQVRKEISQFVSDFVFTYPMTEFAKQYFSDEKSELFMYVFNHKLPKPRYPMPSWTGVVHGNEIPYIFGAPVKNDSGYTKADISFSKMMMNRWATFARTGDPNVVDTGIARWPSYNPTNKDYYVLDLNCVAKSDFRGQKCAFWKHILPLLASLQSALQGAP